MLLTQLLLPCRYLIILLSILFAPFSQAQQDKQTALLLDINGTINPATQDYIHQGILAAGNQQAKLIILRLDTPGGLDKSMREIVKDIIASPIPVIAYVAPSGARAASAGTYILYASHIAAMAPGTNLGAASPIKIGMHEKSTPSAGTNISQKKMQNDAVAYIQSLAQMRHRNVDWAEKTVTQAASLPAEEALQLGVIDYLAKDISELLQKVDNKLATGQLSVKLFEQDWRLRLLNILTDPSIAYVLLLIGIYGIFFEFANPGFMLPGVAGAIALLLALYAFQLLSVNFSGVILILLGIGFMIAEAYIASFGTLGIGGILAFLIGSIMVMEYVPPGSNIAWQLIAIMAAASSIFIFVIANIVLRAQRGAVQIGQEILIGSRAEAIEDFQEEGWVRFQGERWQAQSTVPIHRGQTVKITATNGLILIVAPIEKT